MNGAKRFVITDAGMNDLLRPSLYSAYHHIVNLSAPKSAPRVSADIVGPVCESGDFLAKEREIAETRKATSSPCSTRVLTVFPWPRITTSVPAPPKCFSKEGGRDSSAAASPSRT